MKEIMLNVDNESCRIYEGFSPDHKQQFAQEVSALLQQIAQNERNAKLKKLVQEINDEKDCSYLNAEVLLELLPID